MIGNSEFIYFNAFAIYRLIYKNSDLSSLKLKKTNYKR